MAQILVRDLDAGTLERLKAQAKQHRRSLQGEVKVILIEAITMTRREAHVISTRWQKYLAGQIAGDSAKFIREDRRR